jgi:hypothetical protein
MSASAPSPSTSKKIKQHRCNICNIIFDSIEILNAHNLRSIAKLDIHLQV